MRIIDDIVFEITDFRRFRSTVCNSREWQIAIVVDVIHSDEKAGKVVNLTLDLSCKYARTNIFILY